MLSIESHASVSSRHWRSVADLDGMLTKYTKLIHFSVVAIWRQRTYTVGATRLIPYVSANPVHSASN